MVGYFFFANIGGGVAVSTFLMLGLILDVNTESALVWFRIYAFHFKRANCLFVWFVQVTSCVISGWASLLPLLVQWFYLGGKPVIRLLMASPCLWMGAVIAPWYNPHSHSRVIGSHMLTVRLSKLGGRLFTLGLTVFVFFTTGTLLLSYGIAHLQAQAEDLDVDTEPIFSL